MPGSADVAATAFVLHIREGRVDEYRRRHASVWPRLEAALKATGLIRYDLFLDEPGRRVFGYQLRSTDRVPGDGPEDPAILEWRAHMADVLEMDGDRPRRTSLDHVYRLVAD